MKVGIIYGTKRKKATEALIKWFKSSLEKQEIAVEAKKYNEFTDFNQDAFIIGGAVYGTPLKWGGSVYPRLLKFLEQNQKSLENKPLATFIVCSKMKKREKYMGQILEKLPYKPITQKVFKGYLSEKDKDNFDNQKQIAEIWINEILDKL